SKRPIYFLEIESWQQQDVRIFKDFREKSHDDRSREDSPCRDFPIRQKPIDQKENCHAGDCGKYLCSEKSNNSHEEDVVAKGEEMQQFHVSCAQGDGNQGQDSAGKGQTQRDELIANIRTVIWETPDAVERHFQRKENACRSD